MSTISHITSAPVLVQQVARQASALITLISKVAFVALSYFVATLQALPPLLPLTLAVAAGVLIALIIRDRMYGNPSSGSQEVTLNPAQLNAMVQQIRLEILNVDDLEGRDSSSSISNSDYSSVLSMDQIYGKKEELEVITSFSYNAQVPTEQNYLIGVSPGQVVQSPNTKQKIEEGSNLGGVDPNLISASTKSSASVISALTDPTGGGALSNSELLYKKARAPLLAQSENGDAQGLKKSPFKKITSFITGALRKNSAQVVKEVTNGAVVEANAKRHFNAKEAWKKAYFMILQERTQRKLAKIGGAASSDSQIQVTETKNEDIVVKEDLTTAVLVSEGPVDTASTSSNERVQD